MAWSSRSVHPTIAILRITALLLCGSFTQVAHTADVYGTVTFKPQSPPPVPAQYRSRTLNPILEPDPQPAIVFLETTDGHYPPPAASDTLVIAQQGYQFRPAFTAVRVGAEVSFPNKDTEFHSVFSYSTPKRFDLGRYRPDEPSPVVVFDTPGLVKIYCEIHKHMRSLLLVLETPWFGVTDGKGAFLLSGVPPGDYVLRAFLPDEQILETEITVREGEPLYVALPASP